MAKAYIGLTGPAGCGKDTAAAILAEYGYTPYAFAKPLKEMLATVGLHEPASREDKEKPLKGFNFSYRDAAQKLGTEWARALDQNFWLQVAELRIADLEAVVFTDIRFENEAALLRSKGGKLLHILGRSTALQGATAKHSSENGVTFYQGDVVIDNSGSVGMLRSQLVNVISGIST